MKRYSILVLVLLVGRPLIAEPTCTTATTAQLPLIERPAVHDSGETLVILLTGDGGWAGADEKVAEGLVARGGAVIGVNMRSYLRNKRTPEELATDIGCVAEIYSTRWHRTRLMLLGYSRGADLAPFVVSRWSQALRDRLNMVALVSPATQANFKFHLIDLIRDVAREDDVPVAPELLRLRGLRVVCIYGTEEATSGCRGTDPLYIHAIARPGGHRLTGGFDAVAEILSAGLTPPS